MEVKNIGKSIDFFYIVNHNLVNSNAKYTTFSMHESLSLLISAVVFASKAGVNKSGGKVIMYIVHMDVHSTYPIVGFLHK